VEIIETRAEVGGGGGELGCLICIGGHRLDLNVSDIRHLTLTFVILISEKICRTENCHSDIGRVPISTSESILISDIKIF
jgi:hypothetical protein